jgi:hypothetical protein
MMHGNACLATAVPRCLQPAAPNSSSGGKKAKVLVILIFKDTQVIHSTLYCSLLICVCIARPCFEEKATFNNATLPVYATVGLIRLKLDMS